MKKNSMPAVVLIAAGMLVGMQTLPAETYSLEQYLSKVEQENPDLELSRKQLSTAGHCWKRTACWHRAAAAVVHSLSATALTIFQRSPAFSCVKMYTATYIWLTLINTKELFHGRKLSDFHTRPPNGQRPNQ